MKSAGRKNWPRVTSGEEHLHHVPDGVIVDYLAHEVIRPLDVGFRGRTLRILDSGFRWVHYAPVSEHHALTVQLNAEGVPVQLYVDICDGHGLDEEGVPYTNDLYLDVIAVCDVLPDGSWQVTETEIIDVNELEEALQAGKVTPEQFDLAWLEARKVQAALTMNSFAPLEVLRHYLITKP